MRDRRSEDCASDRYASKAIAETREHQLSPPKKSGERVAALERAASGRGLYALRRRPASDHSGRPPHPTALPGGMPTSRATINEGVPCAELEMVGKAAGCG
jgi:hypothetical protein